MKNYEKPTVEKLSTLIEKRDLNGVAKLLGFIPENMDNSELLMKVNESLSSYVKDGKILHF